MSATKKLVFRKELGFCSMNEIKPIYGPTNPSPEEFARMRVKRFGSVVGLSPEKEQYYRILHSESKQFKSKVFTFEKLDVMYIYTHL